MISAHVSPPWPLVPIKRIAQFVYGDALPADRRDGSGTVPVYGSNGPFGAHSTSNTASPVILIGRKGSVGALNWSDQPAFAIDTVYFVDEEHANCHLRWLYWVLHTAGLHHLSQDTGVPGLSREIAYGISVPFPSPSEQTAIATFLDRETGKIDALVDEQKRLIELLKEKRQAVISHAVTKGLDPNVRMKPSGVEWLGDVPEHWNCIQLGRLCRQISDGPHFSPAYQDTGVMFLSARNIKVDGWSLDDVKFISEEDYSEFCRRVVPEIGDVLYTKGGTTGIARAVDLVERFQVWVHVAVLKLHKNLVDAQFLAHSLNSIGCYEQSQLYTRGATNQDLGLTRMTKIWLALPPLGEQVKILKYLESVVPYLDVLVCSAERSIHLLQERRSALISAAVTGKIDVRNYAQEEAA